MFNSIATTSWLPAIEQLHFIRPWVWLLLIPAVVLFGFHLVKGEHKQGWAQLIDKHLLQWLMPQGAKKSSKFLPWVLLVFWFLALAALSGPSWKQLPQPLFSSKAARVLVLDLSMSMDATDVAPSRLERAQFKIRDLLKQTDDGQTALVVYAGDAFVLSPLTTDGDTIENLLMALSTDLMPLMGSKPETGISKAIELLDNAQVPTGSIIWITDGAELQNLDTLEDIITDSRYKLNILAIGTEQGSPIKLQGGAGFLKDNRGEIVVPKLHYNRLRDFAVAVDAKLTPLSTDDADISLMLEQEEFSFEQQMEEQDMFADSWEDSGFWLIILLLPIVLYAFKQPKVLGVLVLVFTASLLPSTVLAQTINQKSNPVPPLEQSSSFSLDTVTDYFLNDDQKGKKLLDDGDAEGAYEAFKDPNWKAVSAYRQGKFDDAQYNFQAQENGLTEAEALYNKGNAQVMNGEYDAAIQSYQDALEQDSDFTDAQHNLGVAQQLKEQKEKKEQEEQEQDEEQDSENQENSESEEETEQQPEEAPQQESEQQSEQKQQQELDRQFKEEEKDQELEQWLRRISDDPGGLLRRKMYLEYRKRGVNHKVDQTW